MRAGGRSPARWVTPSASLSPPVSRVPGPPPSGPTAPPSPPRAAPAALSGSRAGGSLSRISRKLCSGKLGIALKVLGGVALFWAVFILGYITGYYVHKCK